MSEKIYQIIDHPSDLKIKVFGKGLPDLFCNLVRAIASEQLGNQVFERKCDLQKDVDEIELKAKDPFSLFVDFANEIIYLADANQKVYADCDILNLTETKIKAKLQGINIEKKLDIKAATYHEGYVKKMDNHWEAEILFDI